MVAWEAARLMGYCRGDCDAGVLGSPRCPPTNVAGSTGTPVPVRETWLCQRYLGEVSVPAKVSIPEKCPSQLWCLSQLRCPSPLSCPSQLRCPSQLSVPAKMFFSTKMSVPAMVSIPGKGPS